MCLQCQRVYVGRKEAKPQPRETRYRLGRGYQSRMKVLLRAYMDARRPGRKRAG
jgi:hypothetical protein